MSTDKQEREQEILILKSILDETITELSNDNEQIEVNIEFDLPKNFFVRLVDDFNQLSTSIQYLPPLKLTIHFHDKYPSSIHSPTFVLSSFYLNRQFLHNMCQLLDQIWEKSIGQPIVFQWIQCLKEYFLTINELHLTNKDNDQNENYDPRALSSYDINHIGQIYRQLIEYNREKDNEIFRLQYHECPICATNNIPGRDMIRLYKCYHSFCRQCLQEYSQMCINRGSVEWLTCPDSHCQLALMPLEIKQALNDDKLYERYERLLLQRTLEQMKDISWCPRCQQAVLTGQENDKFAICDQCKFTFCKKCKRTYHSQTLCEDELELFRLKEQRRKLYEKMKGMLFVPDDEERFLREFLAITRMENSTRLCPNPSCQVPIEKNMGCDHMFCTRCNTPFNWSDAIDQSTDTKVLIEKYESDIGKVKIALKNERMRINNSEDVIDSQPLQEPLISKLILKRTRVCANKQCQKFNIKFGADNYLICSHCKRGYCFRCGEPVSHPKAHFGGKCKRYEVLEGNKN